MSKIKTEADLIQSSIEILNKVLPKYPEFTGFSNQQLVTCLELFNSYNESVGLDTLLKDIEQINLSLENGFTSIPELTTIERNIRQFINPTLQPELLATDTNPSSNEKTELSIRQAIVDTFNKQFPELKNQIVSQVANEFRKFNKQNPESGNLDKEVITALNDLSATIETKLHELANLEADTIAKITKTCDSISNKINELNTPKSEDNLNISEHVNIISSGSKKIDNDTKLLVNEIHKFNRSFSYLKNMFTLKQVAIYSVTFFLFMMIFNHFYLNSIVNKTINSYQNQQTAYANIMHNYPYLSDKQKEIIDNLMKNPNYIKEAK